MDDDEDSNFTAAISLCAFLYSGELTSKCRGFYTNDVSIRKKVTGKVYTNYEKHKMTKGQFGALDLQFIFFICLLEYNK